MGKKIVVVRKKPEVDLSRYEDELNKQQLEVVKHNKGQSLVIAGAGSGKTRALTYKVAYLIDNGADPRSILLVTFTKKAAQEMIRRVEELSGPKAKQINAGTFHHIANLALHKYGKSVNLQNNFSILDRSDQNQLMKLIIAKSIPKDNRKKYPKAEQMIKIHSYRINWAISLKEAINSTFPQYADMEKELDGLIRKFMASKHDSNQLDFDDLLLYYLQFLNDEDASKKYRKSIKHVLVDEYQDVNSIQSRIVDRLAIESESFTVVGDDAQSIYRFRGADFHHMLEFPDRYPDTAQYKLEINYRSTSEILNLANASINFNKKQFKKNLEPTRPSGEIPQVCECGNLFEEAELLCQMILNFRDEEIPLHEQAVLFRSGYHKLILEQELIRNNIPYVVRAGLKFFEKAHIKDLMAMLTIIVNPLDNIQWIRVLSMHKGISSAGGAKIIEAFPKGSNYLEEFVKAELPIVLKGKRIRQEGIKNLHNLQVFYLNNIFDKKSNSIKDSKKLQDLPNLMMKAIKYMEPLLKEKYKKEEESKIQDRVNDLKELINFIAKYKDLDAFLKDILTQYDIKGEKINEDYDDKEEKPLVLTTIHQAKGLEWKVVYVISLIEGRFPSARSMDELEEMEEERRLFYVAITRAKDYLYLTYPKWVRNWDAGDSITNISILLKELQDKNVYENAEIEFE
jgi:DNA helicase-2/ATP-dependent DNA helicase PcrA